MASQDEINQYQDLLKHLASLPEAEAANEIRIEAALLTGTNDDVAVVGMVDKLKQDIASYNKITDFDQVAGVYAQNAATSTTSFDDNGVSGQTFKVQHQTPFPKDLGATWGYADANLDNAQNVTGGDIGMNYVGVPGTLADADYVAIGNVNLNIPKDGKLTAQNASFVVGAIEKLHGDPDATNNTVAVITDGVANEVSLYNRQSKPIYRDENLTVTAYQQDVYGIKQDKLNVTGGMRADLDVGNGKAVYLQGSVTASDVLGNNPTMSGQATAGYLWGGTGKNQSELEHRFAMSFPEKTAHTMSSESLKRGLEEAGKVYATLLPESQEKLVNDIATHLIPTGTFNSAEDARNYVQQELNARVNDQGQAPG